MKKQTLIKVIVLCSIVAAILVLDLVTKYVFDASLTGGEVVSVIPYLFNFKLVHNMGAAWGMLAGKQVFLIALTFVFLGIFIFYYIKEKNKTWLLTVAFGFIFGGCIGNLYDRLFLGFVRDFIQFDFWQSFPIFNFADIFLCIGVALFVIYLIVYYVKLHKNGKKDQKIEENKDSSDEN
ncbi:MAG: signal peptidase II [Clostridia bacterium]|nr:signal peptidase II [Clostridia bacterium]